MLTNCYLKTYLKFQIKKWGIGFVLANTENTLISESHWRNRSFPLGRRNQRLRYVIFTALFKGARKHKSRKNIPWNKTNFDVLPSSSEWSSKIHPNDPMNDLTEYYIIRHMLNQCAMFNFDVPQSVFKSDSEDELCQNITDSESENSCHWILICTL